MITDILRPATLREAVKAGAGAGAAFLGGGTWLLSGAAPAITRLVSLEHLDLSRIEHKRGCFHIGASVTLQQLVDDTRLPSALREAARLTASRTLRNMKTLGGAVSRCAPDSALVPVLMALGAEIMRAGRHGELITGLVVMDGSCALRTLSRTSHAPRSLVVAVSQKAIVAADCVGASRRLTELEAACAGGAIPADMEERVRQAFMPVADIHASADFKRYLAGVFVADCLREIAEGGARS